MFSHAVQREQLCILRVGSRCLALPLAEIREFVPAQRLHPVARSVPWIAGLLAEQGTSAWLPVIDLAALWEDSSLAGSWTHLVVTNAGLAIGTCGYSTTQEALTVLDLRPAPGNLALGRATILDAHPMPVLTPSRLIQNDQWLALGATP
jgi:hypothetical protein